MAVEQDDDVMEAYLEGTEPDAATLKRLIRKGTLNFSFVPVLCGSAFKNKGVQPLLDAVVDYLPSPLDVPPVEGIKPDGGRASDTRASDDDAPFSALAFKIMNDPFVGTLTFARIYSGKLETASQVLNSVKDKKEKVGRMLLMHANDREDIQVRLRRRHRRSGGPQGHHHRRHAVRSEHADHPRADGIPRSGDRGRGRAQDQGRPGEDGRRAQPPGAEDPSFRVTTDHEIGPDDHQGDGRAPPRDPRRPHEARVQGRGQCRRAAGRLSRVSREAGRPRPTPTRSSRAARASSREIKIARRARASAARAIDFEDEIKGGNVPKEYIPSVEKGMRETAETGSLIGFPIIDFEGRADRRQVSRRRLVGAGVRDRGPLARCAKRAHKAGIKLLEPIMKVEVVTPEDYIGDVIGDLNSRRGQIQGTDSRGNAQVVEAMVPLANMFGYVNELRSFTQGRAQYTMQFSHYEEVPQRRRRGAKATDPGHVIRRRARIEGDQNEQRRNSSGTSRTCNIGTIGHVDHGKTSLTAAITKVLAETGGAHVHRPTTTSTRRPRSASAASPSRPRTSSTRPRTATTRTSIARATPTM